MSDKPPRPPSPIWFRALRTAILILVVLSVISIVSLVLSIMMPDLSDARAQAQKVVCRVNLQGIVMSVNMYIQEHDEAPATLEALIEDGLMGEDILKCPAAESHRDSDYFYHPPAEDAPKETLIACDYRNNHDGHRNALDLDGTVYWVTEEAFQQLLDKPENAAFARALREAEGW